MHIKGDGDAPLAAVERVVFEPIDAVREPRREEHLLKVRRRLILGSGVGFGLGLGLRLRLGLRSEALQSTSSPGVGQTVRPSMNCLSLAPSVTIMAAGRGSVTRKHPPALPDATRPGTRT